VKMRGFPRIIRNRYLHDRQCANSKVVEQLDPMQRERLARIGSTFRSWPSSYPRRFVRKADHARRALCPHRTRAHPHLTSAGPREPPRDQPPPPPQPPRITSRRVLAPAVGPENPPITHLPCGFAPQNPTSPSEDKHLCPRPLHRPTPPYKVGPCAWLSHPWPLSCFAPRPSTLKTRMRQTVRRSGSPIYPSAGA
jgi:hypothetical protein